MNTLVQAALNGKQEMNRADVLISTATEAATQERGILTTISTIASGASIAVTSKGEEFTSSVFGDALSTLVGAKTGSASSNI